MARTRLMILLLLLIFATPCSRAQQQRRTINVGLMFVKSDPDLILYIGYRTSAAAVLVARDRVRSEHLLDDFDFNFTVVFDECKESLAAGLAVSLIRDSRVHVIIGPTCNLPGVSVATLGTYYDVPVVAWGLTTSPDLRDPERMPTTVTVSIDTYSMSMALLSIFREFNWDQFVFIFSTDDDTEKCTAMKDDVQEMASLSEDVILSYIYQIADVTTASLNTALKEVQTRGRSDLREAEWFDEKYSVIVACFPDGRGFKQAFMLAAYDNNMISDEYVYIIVDTKSKGFIAPDELGTGVYSYIWQEIIDDREDEAKEAFKRVFFVVDMMGQAEVSTKQFEEFSKDVVRRMAEPPFYCTSDCSGVQYSSMAQYASQLYEAFYTYAVALNRTLEQNPDANYRSGDLILSNCGMNFTSIGGNTVTITPNGTRLPTIYMLALNSSVLPETFAKIFVNDTSSLYTPLYTNEQAIWATRGGVRPNSVPLCGFSGKSCPVNFVEAYLVYVVLGAFIVFLAICAAVCGVVYTIRARQNEIQRQNYLWQVPFNTLRAISKKSKGEASFRSLQSGPSSTSTKLTVESRSETTHFVFYTYQVTNDIVVAMKHDTRVQIDSEDSAELRLLRQLEHDNVNRFIGMCLDGPQLMSIWRFCSRGSLEDVIQKSSMRMDSIFVFSLLKDIVNGLSFIHSSFLKQHGKLTSRCCLIDDRWQVKISYYGIHHVRTGDKLAKRDLLWTAPELLRSDAKFGTQEGDIFSFGIICSELVTRRKVYDIDNRKENSEELIYMIKKGGHAPMRPLLQIEETVDVNPALMHLIRDCWAERPSERPDIEVVKSSLRSMTSARNDNLMDHVFNMLESYASTLEQEVDERTKELVEEKKKSDVLLYRMLPKQVADKLKLGQTVEPETFDNVTLFFSDVVSFTKLAGRCTPLQVVNLLNDLYTMFDNIIDEHDVYKVETIGDGYLCVSGLPHRNGNEHSRHIASMALAFMRCLETFRIPHLPNERINLRIGIHCGSVVAGVVGLTMPRYCLFGDAVNTASRMESNGKPGQIHLSQEANRMLTQVIGGFRTESRGEVIIKGKGVLETFWLISMEDDSAPTAKSILRDTEKSAPLAEQRSVTPSDDVDMDDVIREISSDVVSGDDGIYAQYRRQNTLKAL